MKLLTYEFESRQRLGVLVEGGVIDLTAHNDPAFRSMQDLVEGGEAALQRARAVAAAVANPTPADSVRWLSPLPVPAQMRDCLSFETHLKNSFAASVRLATKDAPDPQVAYDAVMASGRGGPPDVWYKQPIYYKANRFACAGHDADVVWPGYSNLMDFELEFACVIGRPGRDIAKDQAASHIFGYTIFNDFSARDAQSAEMSGMLGPAKGKDFDGGNILGPVIVTADEMTDPYKLTMRARVNGETWCEGSSSTMHWRFPDLIEHISRGETLHPGEVICSGTVGWGCGLEHLRFLNHGDVVELDVEGIGTLRNRVIRGDLPH